MRVLGIETSCDETAAAIVETQDLASLPSRANINVLSNVVSSQIEIHKKYGGVVPEMAAREHVLNILPVINEALNLAAVKSKSENRPKGIDAIAVTVGPGLVTSLIVGVETAKTLAYAWKIPVIPINHIEGHIYANFVGVNSNFQTPNDKKIPNSKSQNQKIEFPAIILTVSGGHTMLVLMRGHGRLEVIGETRDDAAGEAFDKAAQLLELGYPGGPAIAKLASLWKLQFPISNFQTNSNDQTQNSKKIILPRPMLGNNNFEFSFSGLKTALLYQVKKDPDWKKRKADYAYEFQQAVIDVLVSKTTKAAKKFNVKTIMLSGGVAANTELRRHMEIAANNMGLPFVMPDLKYCTDNAAMIAAAGCFKAMQKKYIPWQKLKVDANLDLK